MSTAVSEVPAAAPELALAHFSNKLAFETDCWDVHDTMRRRADFVLLDVRSPTLFAAGHAPGAVNLPHQEISTGTLAGYPSDTLFVVYCAGPHCNGADRAAVRLARLNRPVKIMIGGIAGWRTEGFELFGNPWRSHMSASVRPAVRGDLESIIELCSEHARFEGAEPPSVGLGSMSGALLGASRNLLGWVAVEETAIVGYATAAPAFSTWLARAYLHLDCLYLRPHARGNGTGRRLFTAIVDCAREQGHHHMEWQTPRWNTNAIAFYESLGARSSEKMRFSLDVAERRTISRWSLLP